MGLCSLNFTFSTAGERITFVVAVHRAAVDRSIDDAAIFTIWGPGAKGPGTGTQLAPGDPRASL